MTTSGDTQTGLWISFPLPLLDLVAERFGKSQTPYS